MHTNKKTSPELLYKNKPNKNANIKTNCSRVLCFITAAIQTKSHTKAKKACLSSEFQCENGECLALEAVCDGIGDCRRHDDESYGLCNCDHDKVSVRRYRNTTKKYLIFNENHTRDSRQFQNHPKFLVQM